MKVLKNGKEVKNAKVLYGTSGQAVFVEVDGTNYDARAYEIVDTNSKTKTKPASNEEVLTTKDVPANKTAKK